MGKYFNKNKAFTLVEVLTVVLVIAIIAEMTIPSLISNIQDNMLRSKLKKEYSIFLSAITAVTATNGGSLFTSDSSYLLNINESLKDVLSVIKTCSGYNIVSDGCFTSSYKYVGTSYLGISYFNIYPVSYTEDSLALVLKDGASLLLYNATRGTGSLYGVSYADTEYVNFKLDVNGPAPPNVMDSDIYSGSFINYSSKRRYVEIWGSYGTSGSMWR